MQSATVVSKKRFILNTPFRDTEQRVRAKKMTEEVPRLQITVYKTCKIVNNIYLQQIVPEFDYNEDLDELLIDGYNLIHVSDINTHLNKFASLPAYKLQ